MEEPEEKSKKSIKQEEKIKKKNLKKEKKMQKKEKRKKSIAWKIFKIFIILAIIAILIYGGIFLYKMKRNGGGLQGFIATAIGHDENTLKDLDPIRFLVVGISGYEEDYKLADTIMLCSYNPKTQKASILSIPRDTYVGKNKEKASASYKINAVYRNGENLDGMVEAIENITNLEIANYFVIDTDALIQLVDAINGVDFDVPIDMNYDDDGQGLHIHLSAGLQHLNGEQAEGLVRFRHNNNGTSYPTSYGDNDLGRMKTQRAFIEATLKQTLRPENILHLTKIAEIAFNNIKTNMTFNTIKDYIPYAVSFSTENLQTGVLPGASELTNKIWIYNVDKKKTQQIVEELFIEPEVEVIEDEDAVNNIEGTTIQDKNNVNSNISSSSSDVQIEVLNGSGSAKKLSEAVNKLEKKGYHIIKTGNTSTINKTSIINRTNQKTSISNAIKKALGKGEIIKQSNNSKVDYTIILGKDYE